MFFAVVTCAVTISCALTGSFHSKQPYQTQDACVQAMTMALQLVGENPTTYRIACKRGK